MEGGKAGQEKEHDNATTEKPTKLNENDEMALFDGSDLVVVANNSSSSAAPAGGTGAPGGTPTGTEDKIGPEGSPASPTRKRKTPGTAITKVSKETATHASSPTRKKGQSANAKKDKPTPKRKVGKMSAVDKIKPEVDARYSEVCDLIKGAKTCQDLSAITTDLASDIGKWGKKKRSAYQFWSDRRR